MQSDGAEHACESPLTSIVCTCISLFCEGYKGFASIVVALYGMRVAVYLR